jgi:DNA polymerase-3 subunit epsilon
VVVESATIAVSRPIRAPRPHSASEEELARHAAFISTLADPLWAELTQAA